MKLMLNVEELEYLSECLWDYKDEGPPLAGWASSKLNNLRNKVDEALEAAQLSQKRRVGEF